MKRIVFLAMLALGVLTACDNESGGGDDMIWDLVPVTFNIYLSDSEGQDLLDSRYQDNLIKDVSASYEGEEYPLITEQEYYENQSKAQTRYYMPRFFGLMLVRPWKSYTVNDVNNVITYDDYEMVFGEFAGEENVEKREITLNLPNHQQIRLAYKNSFKWNNGKPDKNTVFYLNGLEVKEGTGRDGCFHFRCSEDGIFEYAPY